MASVQPDSLSEFDKLFKQNFPDILEHIFFSLDLDSFKSCREVCRTWRELFSSARYCRKADKLVKEMKMNKRKLLEAAKEGDVNEVQRLLSIGVHPNGDGSTTPLCAAAMEGKIEVIELLLDGGAKPDKSDDSECTPICWAARGHHMDVVTLLLKRGANPNRGKIPAFRYASHERPISYSVSLIAYLVSHPGIAGSYDHCFEMAQKLLNAGADPNITYVGGIHPLSEAIKYSRMDVLMLLVNRGADPNVKDRNGEPLLNIIVQNKVYAVSDMRGKTNMLDNLKQLLDAGANPNMTNEVVAEAKTALWWAVNKEYKGAVRLLLSRGGDPNKGSDRGDTLLNTVLHWQPADAQYFAGLMLDCGADPDKTDHLGMTPLIIAVGRLNSTVEKLLDKGADPNKAALSGITPLFKAAKCGLTDVVELLLKRGANPNQDACSGNTPLHCAARLGKEDVVKVLLDSGALSAAKNSCGVTPLEAAQKAGHSCVVQMLIEKGATP